MVIGSGIYGCMGNEYRVIVADPPWDIGDSYATNTPHGRISEYNSKYGSGFNRRTINANVDERRSMPYKTMTDAELRKWDLPVDAADDSCLFLWTVHQKLELALELITGWGFKYRHTHTWKKLPSTQKSRAGNILPKNSVITGGFWRNSELLLYARRGQAVLESSGEAIPFVFEEKMQEHSAKPPGIYQRIRGKTPGPRIDIFARRRHEGFEAWGDQVESGLQTTL